MRNLEDDIVDVDGLAIHVLRKIEKKRTSPPFLLFNGIGANVELLLPLFEALKGIECIAFDIPGIGASKAPLLPLRFGALSKLSAKILDHYDYGNVDVLGVSWGGGLAQEFARRNEKRCRRLVLVATSPGAIMVPGNPSVFMKLSTPKRYFNRAYMAEIAQHIYGGELRDKPERIHEFSDHIKGGANSRGYLYQLTAIMGWTSIHWLHKLVQPTLIIAGNDDPLVPLANARIMRARIPDSRLLVIECGHLLLLTKTAEVAPQIVEFLQQADTAEFAEALPGPPPV